MVEPRNPHLAIPIFDLRIGLELDPEGFLDGLKRVDQLCGVAVLLEDPVRVLAVARLNDDGRVKESKGFFRDSGVPELGVDVDEEGADPNDVLPFGTAIRVVDNEENPMTVAVDRLEPLALRAKGPLRCGRARRRRHARAPGRSVRGRAGMPGSRWRPAWASIWPNSTPIGTTRAWAR